MIDLSMGDRTFAVDVQLTDFLKRYEDRGIEYCECAVRSL